jgi:hypothetical protein
MDLHRRLAFWINLLGGMAVLGSYVWGLAAHSDAGAALWGGMPQALRPLYTLGMALGALGYLAFTYFLLFRLDPARARVAGRLGYSTFNVLYALILVPSALWMPLTEQMVQQPSPAAWAAIRLVLALVGLAALGMLLALLRLEPRQPRWAWGLALAGAVLFFLHTAILDALVWPAFFPV